MPLRYTRNFSDKSVPTESKITSSVLSLKIIKSPRTSGTKQLNVFSTSARRRATNRKPTFWELTSWTSFSLSNFIKVTLTTWERNNFCYSWSPVPSSPPRLNSQWPRQSTEWSNCSPTRNVSMSQRTRSSSAKMMCCSLLTLTSTCWVPCHLSKDSWGNRICTVNSRPIYWNSRWSNLCSQT